MLVFFYRGTMYCKKQKGENRKEVVRNRELHFFHSKIRKKTMTGMDILKPDFFIGNAEISAYLDFYR